MDTLGQLGMELYGHHNGNFLILLRYKKINKIKFNRIIKKGDSLI